MDTSTPVQLEKVPETSEANNTPPLPITELQHDVLLPVDKPSTDSVPSESQTNEVVDITQETNNGLQWVTNNGYESMKSISEKTENKGDYIFFG